MLCANLDRQQALVDKISEVNRASREGDIIKPQLLREQNALTNDDYREFATWLIERPTVPKRKEIMNKLHDLRKYRLARWHVFSPRKVCPMTLSFEISLLVPSLTGTEATVQYIVEKVPLGALLTGNWGGRVWSQLKKTGNAPPWEKLASSKIWVDVTTYGFLHRELRGQVPAPRADKTDLINTAKGQVKQATIQLSTDRSKVFMWGPLLGVATLQRPAVLYVECSGLYGCAQEVIDLIKEVVDTPLLAIGDPLDVNGLAVALDDCPERVRQSTSLIHLAVDADPVFGPCPPHCKNKSLSIRLLAPTKKLQSHWSHLAVRNLPWPGSIIDYCMFLMNVLPKDYDQTILYVPHPKRSPDELLQRVAYLMSVPPGWTVSLVPPQDFPTDSTTVVATLTSHAQPLHSNTALLRQHQQEVQVFRSGKILDTESQQFKTERELLEEKKREMRSRAQQAQRELMRERTAETTKVSSESEEEQQAPQPSPAKPPPSGPVSSRPSPKEPLSVTARIMQQYQKPRQRAPTESPPARRRSPTRERKRHREAELRRKARQMEESRSPTRSPVRSPSPAPVRAPSRAPVLKPFKPRKHTIRKRKHPTAEEEDRPPFNMPDVE